MYIEGQSVPQDYVLAHIWSNLAAALIMDSDRKESAQENRDNVAEKMTPDQIAKGQRMAREWMAKHQQ